MKQSEPTNSAFANRIEPAGGWESLSPARRRAALSQLRDLAVDRHKSGDLTTAYLSYREYLDQVPEDAGAWSNIASILRKQGHHRAAVSCQRRAIFLAPKDPVICHNLVNALVDAGMSEEALTACEQLLKLGPDDPSSFVLYCICLRGVRQPEQALRVAKDALTRWPENCRLRVQKAIAELTMGHYSEGFSEFNARWEVGEIGKPPLKEPEWTGESLTKKSIIAMPEQGFGDTLLMARFLPLLELRAERLLLGCKPPLRRLFEGVDYLDEVAEIGKTKPNFDYFVNLMDLPKLVWDTSVAPPPPVSLKVPRDSAQRASQLISRYLQRFRVGIVWSGSVTYGSNHKRSIPFDEFLVLADVPGVQLFSLYKGPQLDSLRKSAVSLLVVDACGEDRDFADAAALIEVMNLIITVDTAIAHLAGSLNKPVWNLLDYSPYWLYGLDGDTTPWYPSMRLYRQARPGNWRDVIQRVRRDLVELVRDSESAR